MRGIKLLMVGLCMGLLILMADIGHTEEKEGNPLLGGLQEIISWTQKNSIGLSGVYDDNLTLTASVQLAQSKHNWLHAGVSVLPSTKPEDLGLGGYAGFNLAKIIEKIKGEELETINSLDVGYSWIYTFPDHKKGIFGFFLKKEI
jgi:hypothetical protein